MILTELSYHASHHDYSVIRHVWAIKKHAHLSDRNRPSAQYRNVGAHDHD